MIVIVSCYVVQLNSLSSLLLGTIDPHRLRCKIHPRK